MPISITASAVTFFNLITERWDCTRFWRPYVVKWLSWWVANSVASAMALGGLMSVLEAIGAGRISYLFLLLPPSIRLCIHAAEDIRRLRWLRVNGGDLSVAAAI